MASLPVEVYYYSSYNNGSMQEKLNKIYHLNYL